MRITAGGRMARNAIQRGMRRSIQYPFAGWEKAEIQVSFYPEIPAEYWIDSSTEKFLRFDYKDGKRMDWLHVVEPEKWY